MQYASGVSIMTFHLSHRTIANYKNKILAEREGLEPPVMDLESIGLPLTERSAILAVGEGVEPPQVSPVPFQGTDIPLVKPTKHLAVGEGLEPPKLSPHCFQDRCFNQLSHPTSIFSSLSS